MSALLSVLYMAVVRLSGLSASETTCTAVKVPLHHQKSSLFTMTTTAGLLRIAAVLVASPADHLTDLGALLAEVPAEVLVTTEVSGTRC